MKFLKSCLMIAVLLMLFLTVGNAFAGDIDDLNSTVDNSVISQDSGEIEVENWEDIQYYASLNDKDYVLKLKDDTNYYPKNPKSSDNQIIFNNNVTIIGSHGAYIGDSQANSQNITYTAMKVPENSHVGITFNNVTFKWISTSYQPDGVFLQMAGGAVNTFNNCLFTEISTDMGRSSILHVNLGDAIITNCSFINCTTDFGCINVFNRNDNPSGLCTLARMNVTDSYFEGNYARTAPGCINNCGILVVRNSTFCRNSAFWWAGAIHTTGGANTTLYDCCFHDNLAGWNGGALYTYSYLQIFNTTFINNNCTTSNGGGAIGACKYQHAPYIYVQDSLFVNNENTCWALNELSTSGTGRGGAISIMDEGGIEVRNTTFIKNSASHGTAICAISAGAYGSPDVVLVGNTFINHTRVGDVLDIRLASSSYCEIRDNYYYNNSFEFKKLRLLADEKTGDDIVIHIDAELKNPDCFESDILDVTSYDIYVDGVYNMTVVGKTFTLTLKNGRTCNVYAVPLISNSVSNEIFVGIPKEYVYVSQKLGSDTNDGLNRSSPVNSIAKAVEIAKTKGNIIIMDGIFNETGFTIDYDLNIIAEEGVKFTGTSASTIFTVTDSDFSISNIVFDSLVFTTKSTGIIRQTGGFTTVDNCTFNANYVSALTGTDLIEAKSIEVYNSKFTNHNKNKVYMTLIKADEFLIDNCVFKNNIASQTTYYALVTTSSSKSGVKATVSDSLFESNTVKNGCIYFAGSSAPMTVTDTRFIANKVASANDYASCIKIENSPTVKIDSSVFIDNVDLGSKSAVIHVSGAYASVFVSDSIIVNNSYQNTFGMVFSASTSGNLNVYKNLDGNWWGNTLENYTLAPPVHSAACNNWLVMNMTSNVTDLAINQKALISVDFFNTVDRLGNSSFYDGGNLPEFDLDVDAVNGTVSSSKITVIKGSASVEYTLESLIRGSLSLCYRNVESSIKFKWSLIDADIDIVAGDVSYGNSAEISITSPDDLDVSKFVLLINNVSYDFNKTIFIPKAGAGNYLINLTYKGDSKYAPKTYLKDFNIKKASPQINVNISDTYYGNTVKVTLTTDFDVNGDAEIRVADIYDKKAISDGKTEFSIDSLPAGSYTAEIIYLGSDNFMSCNVTSSFNVKKYNSTLTISKGDIKLGSDVIITFAVNSDATGYITVDVNGKKENVSISGGTAAYTIKNISGGFYAVKATYSGDEKYLNSMNSTEIDIGRLNATLNVDVGNITFRQLAVFTISLNSDASGNLTLTIDGINYTSEVNQGFAQLNLSDLTAGDKTAEISYSGDFTYLAGKVTKSFNIAKAEPELTIDIEDIKEGMSLNVQITITKGATGTLEIITPKESENADIPRTGLFTRSLLDLSSGEYNISAIYAGDDNYLATQTTKTFHVTQWDNPQWPNEGYDAKNSKKSPYTSDSNGHIAWISEIDADIIGNMVLDSKGNIYIATSKGIYSLNNSDGSINWIFSSNDAGDNFSGVAVGRDMILSPKSGHKLFLINQTTGIALNNNIFQASSYFTPIVDENANIYVTSEYQTSTSSYNLVVVPYSVWQFTTNPVLINMGTSAPTAAPVLINNNTVAVPTEDSLKIIDLASRAVTDSFKITTFIRPVISDNIIYTIADNCIVAITPDGNMWKVRINGTAGNYLSVGENGEIFSATKEGVLYEYSTGEELFIYDFKNNVSQAVLVSNNNVLYVGCENGEFFSIDGEGNLLWKVGLNESLSGLPVMDQNGVIYVIGASRIIAMDYKPLKDSNITVSVDDVEYGSDVTLDIGLDFDATGKIAINVNDAYINSSDIVNGHVSFVISNLNVGNYTAKITYDGDSVFKSQIIEASFEVSKISAVKMNTSLIIHAGDIECGENLHVIINLSRDAGGNVSVSVANISQRQKIRDGIAEFDFYNLTSGRYDIVAEYEGDDKYLPAAENKSVTVSFIEMTGMDVSMLYTSGSYYKVYLSRDGSPFADKTVLLTIAGKTYHCTTGDDGYASFKITLAPKTYSVTAVYGNLKITNKLTVKNIINAKNVNAKRSAKSIKIKVSLKKINNKYLKGKTLKLKFNKKTFKAKTNKNGVATFTIKNSVFKKLKIAKKYTYQVTYAKNTIKKTIRFKK